jgi:hypothetical protein
VLTRFRILFRFSWFRLPSSVKPYWAEEAEAAIESTSRLAFLFASKTLSNFRTFGSLPNDYGCAFSWDCETGLRSH